MWHRLVNKIGNNSIENDYNIFFLYGERDLPIPNSGMLSV